MKTTKQTDQEQVNNPGIEAIILDMDGVITQTAKVHKEAWKKMFNEFLKEQDKDYSLMTDEDYIRYVDGKPRLEGVRSFLDSRNINLPEGLAHDALDAETINALGNKKNAHFLKLIHDQGVDIYDDTIEKIKQWRSTGIKTAVVSSSKNCRHILETAGIDNLFDARVDGNVALDKNIKGKPEPDIFLEAAKQLNTGPEKCVVYEDAIAGVQAGSRGDFALVVGVDRSGNNSELYENGADVVVRTLNEIDPYLTHSLPSALKKESGILTTITKKTPVLFCDYDGTLTPIVKHPEDAILSNEMKRLLKECSSIFTVAIISGRDMDDVKNMVGIQNIIYAGSHGYRISGPDGLHMEHEKAEKLLPGLDEIEKKLQSSLKEIEGIQIERKRYAIGVHFRNADKNDVTEIIKETDNIVKHFPEFRKGEGKKIIEIKPNIDWHKGRAICWILEKLGFADKPDMIPVYIGDDVTDEDAFRILSDNGIGILVGHHQQSTDAKFALKNVYQVRLFLELISELKKTNT